MTQGFVMYARFLFLFDIVLLASHGLVGQITQPVQGLAYL